MKQKDVKYHNPINTAVWWHSRSAENAQECNRSQTGVEQYFVFVRRVQEAADSSPTKAAERTFYLVI